LVHPEDKEDKEQTSECVYRDPCANCDKTYVGETGRKLMPGCKNIELKWSSKPSELLPEVSTPALQQNTTKRLPPTIRKPRDKLV